MAIDGVVVDVETTYDVAYIAEYLDKNYSQYDLGASNGINVAGKAYADVLKILTTELQGIYMPGFAGATSLYDGKVTIFMVGDKVVKATKDNLLATTYTTDVEANLYYVVNDNGTITAWIVTGATIAGTATLKSITEGGVDAMEALKSKAPSVKWQLTSKGYIAIVTNWDGEAFAVAGDSYTEYTTSTGKIGGGAGKTGTQSVTVFPSKNWGDPVTVTVTVTRDVYDTIVFTYEF